MKHIQYIIITFLLIGSIIHTQAQNTVWGKYEVKLLEEEKKLKVTFSYLNDIFYTVPGNEEGNVILGNEQYKVIYSSKGDKGFLVEILAGKEYMSNEQIDMQKKGFPYSDGQEGLNIVMQKFAKLSDSFYHPPKDFKSGWTDEKETHINYMELLGKGEAYYGSHNKEGEKDGLGTYILSADQAYTGHFDKGILNGEVIVGTKGNYDFKGEFANNEKIGTWLQRKKTYPNEGFLTEVEFVDGTVIPKKELSKKQDESLTTSMEEVMSYESYRKEIKTDGQWKRDLSLNGSLEFFEIYDKYHTSTFVRYMKVNAKKTVVEDTKDYQMHLVKVEEDDEKRVEYYSYTFKEDFGHTSPTITIYKKRKEGSDSFMKDYNILFYFPHEKGEYRYYFLMDEERKEKVKQAQETHRLIDEALKASQEALKKLEEMEKND